jgi:hypothetical protein
MAYLGGSSVPARLRVRAAVRQRFHISSVHRPSGRTTPRSPCGVAGADELVEFGREIEHGVRQKTRSRAGTPDAGALLFNVLLL